MNGNVESVVQLLRFLPPWTLSGVTARDTANNWAEQTALTDITGRWTVSDNPKLVAWIGYDAPMKVWIDGQENFYDPEGINPALPEDASAPRAHSRASMVCPYRSTPAPGAAACGPPCG